MKALLRFDGKFCFQKIPGLSVLLNICDLFSGSLNSPIIYSLVCHRLPIATICYIVLLDFSSLAFSLIRRRGKDNDM